jgi:hypothetical protein
MNARSVCAGLAALALLAADAPSRDLALDDLLTHMRSTRGVLAEFHEVKTLKLLDAPLESKGTVYFSPPTASRMITREPAETRLRARRRAHALPDAAGGATSTFRRIRSRARSPQSDGAWRGDRAGAGGDLHALDFHSEARAGTGTPLEARRWTASCTRSRCTATARRCARSTCSSDGDRTQTLFDKVDVDHEFGDAEARAVFGTGRSESRRAPARLGGALPSCSPIACAASTSRPTS